jgi:hypothetical protein
MILDQTWLDETGLKWPPDDICECFYCGAAVSPPLIEWLGLGGHGATYFHAECAVEFTIRLMRDVHEYECRHVKGEMIKPEIAAQTALAQQLPYPLGP